MKSSSASANPQFPAVAKVSLQILLLLGVLVALAVVVAALGGGATARDVGTTLFWCGLGVLAVGIFSIGGTRATARGFSAQMAQTLDADTTGARARRAGAEMVLQFAWPLRLVVAGGLAVAIGALLGA
jgi:hypothetical protein